LRSPASARSLTLPPAQPLKIHKKAGGDSKRIPAAGATEKVDEQMECKDCSNPFTFTVGEQEFFESKGFDNKPVRPSPRPSPRPPPRPRG